MRDLGKPTRRVGRPKEDAIKNRILASLRKIPRSWWIKIHGGPMQAAGTPDILGVVEGQFVAIEVKRPGEQPSKLQERVLCLLHAAGARTGVASYPDEALRIAIGDEALRIAIEKAIRCPP